MRAESGEMCELLHTSNHHYFDGNNNGVYISVGQVPVYLVRMLQRTLPAGFIAAVPSNAH